MYDRAGGCLRSFQMIRALRAAGHSVAFYAVGQAIERVRYGAALSRIGVPLYGADPRERADLEGASEPALQVWSSLHTPQIAALCHDRQVDVVIVAPWTTAKAVLAHIRTTVPGARVIVDSVDLAFVREEREAAFQSCGAAELARRREQELDVYRAADQVVCSSQREADVLKAALAGCDVRVVGLCNDALPAASSQGQRSGLLTVANANHPPNLDGLAWYAKEIGPRLAELLPGVKLTVIGNDPVGALAQLASEHVEVIGWVPDTRPYLEKARVSVAPLRYGAGVKGKVAEALAAGLPVVGTTMAVEGMGLTAGLDVEVADDPAMFAAAIARLYKDADRWEEMQRNGRAAAERTAGVANMARQMASLMGSRFAPVPDGWTSPFAPSAPAAAAPAPSHGAEVATTAPMPKPDAPTLDLAAARAPAAPQATAQGQATASARPHSGRVTAPGPVGGAGRGKVARRGGQGHRAGTTGSAAKPGRVLISACLIVKDEEEALPECLASLRGLADEVVVYDTGSTDATIDIARRSGAKVIEGYWDDDFGRARNASLAQCRGEWILWIDADERFRCENTPQLRSMLQKGFEQESLAIEIYNLADDLEDANINIHRALRMFKRSRCQWYGSIHEQVDLRPGLEGKVQAMPVKGAYIEHIGYRSEVVNKRDKLVRNLRLAEAALVKDTVGDMRGQEGVPELNMGRALSALGRFEEAQPYFDASLAIVGPGVTRRVSLMFDAQNLMSLGRYAEAAEVARQFGDACEKKGLGRYLEGLCYRRLGDPAKAVELLAAVEGLDNEDGFVFAVTLLRAELAGALCDLGRFGEAADQLALLVEESSDVHHIRAALKVFAYTGRSLEELAAAMPENRLEKMAAALLLVPPVVADPVAEALFRRFGARPLLLAAAIRFAPMVATQRALEWSARLRQIGMTEPCPLIGQAMIDILEVPVRVRAAVTAHAAFGDERGADLAVALAPGLHHDQLALAVKEVCLLDPPLVARFCPAAAAPGAPDAGAVGSEADRRLEVASALEDAGHGELAAQIRKHDGAVAAGPQLVILGADR
jgi:glycosyltransferase involved in cell wall biosynthesis/tetratricopeptide (TPR) repeat protein